ncbi:hypothetical protein K7X08_017899 [Anisodus acutangulus]|uniref:F-box domain-containing protein n=1 Tax=Anisodus acutangulus TaxID=402998 RepID=A0A9Q1LUM9_9SOLA|nr:hypothetical protein K7X08_017899 [Anisodus acutangulus]
MPPKGKGTCKKKGNSEKIKNRAPNPTSDCINSHGKIICNILSRLPVKTLLQFRCVCKKWRSTISNSNFIITHFQHSSSLQRTNSSILIKTRHSDSESSYHALSLFDTLQSSIVELDNPFPYFIPHMYILGPCNGIMCFYQPPWGDVITLWNPSMRRSRMVKLSETKPLKGVHTFVSVGLAFEPQENDFLILRIFCVSPTIHDVPNHVEMCSMKSLGVKGFPIRWEKLKNEMVFYTLRYNCDTIIKGVPYWLAYINDIVLRQTLVRFDVGKMVLEKLPVPPVIREGDYKHYLANFEDSPGMFVLEKRVGFCIDVWIMDEEDGWSKKCNIGPLLGIDRILGCLWNGNIVAENYDNKLLVLFDPVTNSVKAGLEIDNAKKGSYMIFNYSESLHLVEGMLTVKRQDVLTHGLLRDCEEFMQLQ